jgi:hypothetical protein
VRISGGSSWCANKIDAGGRLHAETMNGEQFRVIRSLLVTIVILLGFITGILLAMAWEYL